MTEPITNDDANPPFEWAFSKTFDEQGRLIALVQFPVAKDGVCGECRGSGRVVLLTSSNHCPHCLRSGRRLITLKPITTTYTYDLDGGTEQPAKGQGEANPNPAPPTPENNL